MCFIDWALESPDSVSLYKLCTCIVDLRYSFEAFLMIRIVMSGFRYFTDYTRIS
jgi:hypothetical protein